MIANLIRSTQMFSLTLPEKVKGKFDLTIGGRKEAPEILAEIEASDAGWCLKCRRDVQADKQHGTASSRPILNPGDLFLLTNRKTGEKMILFMEKSDPTRQTLRRISVSGGCVLNIGRDPSNNLSYNNEYVSSSHASLAYDGEGWSISDRGSRNGTYVNGARVTDKKLSAGDYIYIMGLKIVIGRDYLAVNNPDEQLKIHADKLALPQPEKRTVTETEEDIPEKEPFIRSPHFRKEILHEEIRIDAPPTPEKSDTVPMALMLGPAITMGFTSASTALISVLNILANNGKISQALPAIIMAIGMLLGTILWPIITKKYEKKQSIRNEEKRRSTYLKYLQQIGEEITRIGSEQRSILEENHDGPQACAERAIRKNPGLFERVIGDPDFLSLRLGLGALPIDMELKYPEERFSVTQDPLLESMYTFSKEPDILQNVPVFFSLAENFVTGLYGEPVYREELLKTLILQMISLHSYDELKIMLFVRKEERGKWAFLRFVPHLFTNDKALRFYSESTEDAKELAAYIEKNILIREDEDFRRDEVAAPHYVLICTDPLQLQKTEALRKLMNYKNPSGFSLIITGNTQVDFPKEVSAVIKAGGEYSEFGSRRNGAGNPLSFRMDHVESRLLEKAAEELSNTELDLKSQSYTLPDSLSFLEMFRVGKVEHLNILNRWKENNPAKSLQAPVGVGEDGDLITLDLHERFHGPHGLVAGMTGSGKSEFIITYILSLAVNYHPDEVSFILIDYKGGGLAGAFLDEERGIKLPHLAGTITNLDGASINRSLVSIQSELRRRQKIFNAARKTANAGTMDIYKYQKLYRDHLVSEPVPHLFIISDEFAELKAQQPEFMEQLISTARIGRSLGVHLILATQKPNGVVDDQIWSNSKFRVCLKVQDAADSNDMIKCPDAASIVQTGRFYLQVGFNELFELGQSAWSGADYVPAETLEKKQETELEFIDHVGQTVMKARAPKKREEETQVTRQVVEVVHYLSDLAAEEKVSVRPLWLPPIPRRIYQKALEEKYSRKDSGFILDPVIGEYDDPFNQKQDVLTLPLTESGNCLLFGSQGNGKTTFLTTLCYALITGHTPEEINLYIMDFGSETLKAFEKAPQVGGVCLSSSEEKVRNLLKMLRTESDRRRVLFSEFGGDYISYIRNSGTTLPNIVVILNNFSGFSEQYEDLLEEFNILVRDGVKYGIIFVVTAASPNAVRYRTQQNFRMLLTMQLNDPTDYPTIVGKTEGILPSRYKGRGLVALDKVYEFQTAYCTEAEDPLPVIRSLAKELSEKYSVKAPAIPVLPETVDLDFVREACTGLSGIPLGVAKEELNIECVDLRDKVIYPVFSQDLSDLTGFAGVFIRLLETAGPLTVIDEEKALGYGNAVSGREDSEQLVIQLFSEMVKRNNTYKEAGMDTASLKGFEEKTYVIFGFRKLMDILSEDARDKMNVLLEKAEACYKLHFVIFEGNTDAGTFARENWYKRQTASGEGLWVGDGVAEQYLLKLSKLTSDHYAEIGERFGYQIRKGRAKLLKVLSEEE